MLRYPTSLDVWQLGSAVQQQQLTANTNLKLEQEPARLLQLKAKEDEWIVCAAISPRADFIAYATDSAIYVRQFVQVRTLILFSALFLR